MDEPGPALLYYVGDTTFKSLDLCVCPYSPTFTLLPPVSVSLCFVFVPEKEGLFKTSGAYPASLCTFRPPSSRTTTAVGKVKRNGYCGIVQTVCFYKQHMRCIHVTCFCWLYTGITK